MANYRTRTNVVLNKGIIVLLVKSEIKIITAIESNGDDCLVFHYK